MPFTNPDFGSFRLGDSMAAGQNLAANKFRIDEQQRAVQSRASLEQGLRTGDLSQAKQEFPIETQKYEQDQAAALAKLNSEQIDSALKKIDFGSQLLASSKDEPSYQQARQVAEQNKLDISKWPANFDPNFVSTSVNQGMTVKQRLEERKQVLEESKAASEAKKNAAMANYYNANADLLKGDGEGGIGSFTEGAIEDAAHRYLITGTLPPNIGRGKQGSTVIGKIISKADAIGKEAGLSPEELALAQVSNKSGLAALTQISKQESMVGAFEKNFLKNSDLLLEQSAKTDRTGVPAVNRWLLAGKKSLAGDPEVAKLDLAVKTVVNEYTKIISGAMGNAQMAEGEIQKVEGMLSAAHTDEQVRAVIGFMKRETANRMQGFKEQKSQIVNSMKIGKQNTTALPAAPAVQGNVPLQNSKGWTLHQDAKGNKAYVGPNGEVEEVQ